MAIQWLLDFGLIYKVPRVGKPALPLKAYLNLDVFKIYLLDVGLLGINIIPNMLCGHQCLIIGNRNG